MTISTSQSSQTFVGNGATTAFNFSFVADSASYISVIYTNASGVRTTLSPSQYTLSINAPVSGQIWGVGGTVTYPLSGGPIATGASITISRVLPLTQIISISNQGNFSVQVIETALDTLCMQIQQVNNLVTAPSLIGSAAPYFYPTGSAVPPSGYGIYEPANGTLGIAVGGQLSALFAVPPNTNTYTPNTGSPIGGLYMNAGNTANYQYVTPGIGPAPSAGLLFVNGAYADSTAGNISNIFATAYNTGSRYTAAVTGIAVNPAGTTAGNVWGGQFSAIAVGNANGILQGVNIEADKGTNTSVTAIGATIKIGDSTGTQTVANPGLAYVSLIADPYVAPLKAIRLQDTVNNPMAITGTILGGDGGVNILRCAYGINLQNMVFSSAAFASPGFSVTGSGKLTSMLAEILDGNAATAFKVINNASGTGGGSVVFFPGNSTTGQNPEFGVGGNAVNQGISFRGVGNWFHAFHSTTTGSAKVALYARNDEVNSVKLAAPDTISSSYNFTFPAALVNPGSLLVDTGGGVMGFTSNVANGSVATVLGSAGPTGSNTSVQGWVKIPVGGGNFGYIPYF